MSKKKDAGRYWYRHHVGECPVCGRDGSWKERVQGQKPGAIEERYIQETMYCGCMNRGDR